MLIKVGQGPTGRKGREGKEPDRLEEERREKKDRMSRSRQGRSSLYTIPMVQSNPEAKRVEGYKGWAWRVNGVWKGRVSNPQKSVRTSEPDR